MKPKKEKRAEYYAVVIELLDVSLGNYDRANGKPALTVMVANSHSGEVIPWTMPEAMGKKLATKILVAFATYDDTFAQRVLDNHFATDKDRNFVWPGKPYESY